ncbi:MAG: hypothetical protein ACN4GZ_00235, partial [Acidimicrobiales bacterium]
PSIPPFLMGISTDSPVRLSVMVTDSDTCGSSLGGAQIQAAGDGMKHPVVLAALLMVLQIRM